MVKGNDAALRCDLLKNSYLCKVNNIVLKRNANANEVVICLKIRTFVR